jgi:hypothetical protein
MKFRNSTEDARDIPALGITVDPGQTTPDLSDDEAAGFIGQADVWSAVGSDAKSVQQDVVAAQAPADANEGTV